MSLGTLVLILGSAGCATTQSSRTTSRDKTAKGAGIGAAAGAVVLGVSKDSVKKHDKFRDKHNLGVVLLSDENSDTCERYGVWVEKSMYGKTYMGIERATFLIDGAGKITQIWRKVKVPGHVDAVLAAARAL